MRQEQQSVTYWFYAWRRLYVLGLCRRPAFISASLEWGVDAGYCLDGVQDTYYLYA